MDDFSREFCNWDKLREQRDKIKTEIDNNIENLRKRYPTTYMEYNNKEYKTFVDYLIFLKEILGAINNEEKYDKLVSLIEIFCYLSEIEFILTQIRLGKYLY